MSLEIKSFAIVNAKKHLIIGIKYLCRMVPNCLWMQNEFLENLNFEKIVVSFVKESQRMNGKVSFPFDYLERMCIDLLNANDICTSRRTSRFTESD